jgi:ribosome-binding factor A
MSVQFTRTDRLNEEIRRELDRVIREDVHDPRVSGTYSITRVEVTRDLRYAKVFISVLEEELRVPLFVALRRAAGFIRHALGQRVQVRYTPELLFELDTNIEYGARMASLIDAVTGAERAAAAESEADPGVSPASEATEDEETEDVEGGDDGNA